jgi:hypothetical protein
MTPQQLTTKARKQFNISVVFLSNWLLLTALGRKAECTNPSDGTT